MSHENPQEEIKPGETDSSQQETTPREEKKESKKGFGVDSMLKCALAFSILLVGFTVFYYFVIIIPKQKTKEIELKKQQIKMKQQEVEEKRTEKNEREHRLIEIESEKNMCLLNTDVEYLSNWIEDCKRLGIHIKDGGCSLPSDNADRLDKWLADEKKRCIEQYKLSIQSATKPRW